eukprot:4252493-Prymnesium_polylepis.1
MICDPGKKEKIEFKSMVEVQKKKRFKMTPGKGHSISIKAGADEYVFNGFGARDEASQIRTPLARLGHRSPD